MSTKSTILVADDNATNRKVLVRALEKDEYEVREAGDGFVAVDLARQYPPSVILLDVMMPGRDGFEVCEILKADPQTASVPIIFVTAKSDSADIERAFAAGASDYVTKPFRLSEVRARVSVQMNLRKSQDELADRNQELERMTHAVAETNLKLARQARLDPLTSLLNRRAWEACATAEHERHVRHGSPYAILMLDVDRFKAFNDTQGHQAGDRCLKSVADRLTATCRVTDVVGRYGGEEFVVLAPESDEQAAVRLGERIREAVAALAIDHPTGNVSPTVTVSVGVAKSGAEGWESVLHSADQALYAAKNSGRNRVCRPQDVHSVVASGDPSGASGLDEAGADDPKVTHAPSRVLLVFSGQTDHSALRAALQAKDLTTFEAADEKEAHHAISRLSPDAVVLDASLPNEGAIRLTRVVRERSQETHVPVFVVGETGTPEEVRNFGLAGVDECIAHRMNPDEIQRRITYALEQSVDRERLAASYEARGEQTRILMLLFEYCRKLVECRQRRDVLEETIYTVSVIAGCRKVAVLSSPHKDGSFRIEASVGLNRNHSAPRVVDPTVTDVFTTGQTVVFGDPIERGASSSCPPDWFDGGGPQAFFAIPVGESIGAVLAAGDRLTRLPFEQRMLDSIDLAVGVAATALYGTETMRARDRAHDAIMLAFAKLAEHRDDATHRHVERVTQYSLALARTLRGQELYGEEITDSLLYDLERAAPLHDIGKVAIPDSILLKAGRLSPEEQGVMQRHAVAGAETIRSVRSQAPDFSMLAVAEQIARAHHEWFDGSGYPAGLGGHDIPLAARIVAVADAYDAITTRRPYKPPLSHDEAITRILEASGTQFDPVVVDALVQRQEDFKRLHAENPDEADESTPTDRPRPTAAAASAGGRAGTCSPTR